MFERDFGEITVSGILTTYSVYFTEGSLLKWGAPRLWLS